MNFYSILVSLSLLSIFSIDAMAFQQHLTNENSSKRSFAKSNSLEQNGSASSSKKAKIKKKISLNFVEDEEDAVSGSSKDRNEASDSKHHSRLSKRGEENSADKKVGFSSTMVLGYSNSAYRYAGEDYPTKSINYVFNPSFEAKCLSATCISFLKIAGLFDQNKSGEHSFEALQLGFKLQTTPWSGYLKPSYTITGNFPAKPEELGKDAFQFGVGGAFSLATTPELMDSDFLSFIGMVNIRRNFHDGDPTTQTQWASRQSLTTNLQFTEKWSASFVAAHVWGLTYLSEPKDILELNETIGWEATKNVKLTLEHSNGSPMFNADGSRLDTNLVSIDNSVITFGLELSNSF